MSLAESIRAAGGHFGAEGLWAETALAKTKPATRKSGENTIPPHMARRSRENDVRPGDFHMVPPCRKADDNTELPIVKSRVLSSLFPSLDTDSYIDSGLSAEGISVGRVNLRVAGTPKTVHYLATNKTMLLHYRRHAAQVSWPILRLPLFPFLLCSLSGYQRAMASLALLLPLLAPFPHQRCGRRWLGHCDLPTHCWRTRSRHVWFPHTPR